MARHKWYVSKVVGLCQKQGIAMDSHQIGILESLKKAAPSLAELYEGAVRMLENKLFPGRTRFIAHAVREIANRLPGAVGGEVIKKHLDYHKEIGPIAEEWKKEGLANTVVAVGSSDESGLGLRISQGLVAKVNALLEKDQEVCTRKEGNVEAMIHKLVPESSNTGESLVPIIRHWVDIVEWFVHNVHEGEEERKPVDEDVIQQKFHAFENALRALFLAFYSGLEEVERAVKSANSYEREPTIEEVEQILSLLLVPQYRSWFFENLQNPLWLSPLKARGLFATPPGPVEDKQIGAVRYSYWAELGYLKRMARDHSTKVLEIIMGLQDVSNPLVKTGCIEVLCEMAPAEAAKGIRLVREGIKERTAYVWYWEGEAAAKLMLKLGETGREEAFHIAYLLLDVWVPTDRERRVWHDTEARFDAYHYAELVLKFYKKIWEINAQRAVRVLIKILDRHLLELNKDSDYDRSENFYIGMENLDAIDKSERDYTATLIEATCEAGKAVIKQNPDKIDGLLGLLRAKGKAIFTRIEMHLLRFVPKETHKGRITEILLNKALFDGPGFRYEYDLLLRDKIDEVREVVEKPYTTWIDGIRFDERQKEGFAQWFQENRGRECGPQDIEQCENRMRAERIYRVGRQFPELYARCKEKAAVTDEELELGLKPQIGRGDFPLVEASPVTVENMLTMEPGSALDYLLDPTNYRGKRKPGMWHDPEESLRYTFGEVVRQRISAYVDHSLNEKLIKLDPTFLGTYLNRVMAVVKEKDVGAAFWTPWLELVQLIVELAVGRREYRNCLSDILWTLQEGLGEHYHIESDVYNVATIWQILKSLVKYKEEKQEDEVVGLANEDPLEVLCKSVAGKALEQAVSFAIVCKKRQKPSYEDHLQAEVRAILDYVVNEVKRPEVNCAFGSEFARIHWLDEEWLRKNLDKVFEGDMWDVVWGTYMSWGRAWPSTFKLLVNTGKYQHAIDLIGTPKKYKFQKDPEEGLAEHLMMAVFNGWFAGGCKDDLLLQFLKKAPAKLRGHGAEFLTTGFEALKKEGANRAITDRLREYWEGRLAAMSGRAKEDFDEALAFVSWAENSPIEPSETLRLLYDTLELTGGKLGHRTHEFVTGVCAMGKGNELAAIRCLRKAMADDEIAMYFSVYEKELIGFMESIVELRDSYLNVMEIWKEAIQLVPFPVGEFRDGGGILGKEEERGLTFLPVRT